MLSVIIPVYNNEKYLEECLNSIRNQTYKDLEIICVNDGSTDNSLQILRDFEKIDNRFKVINQENKGVSETRNVGLNSASGNYITFIDSDDVLELNAYEEALKHINDADVVCFGIKVFGENLISIRNADNEYYRIKYIGKKLLTEDLLLKTDVSCCNKIFKMDIIKKYNIHFPTNLHYEDANFYWKYMLLCQNAYFIDKYFYNYRRRDNSIMANTFSGCDFILDHLHITKDLYLFFVKNNIYKKYKKLFCKFFKNYTLFVYHTIIEEEKINALNLARKYAEEFFPKENPTLFIKHIKKGKYSNLLEKDLNFLQKIFSVTSAPNFFTQEKYKKIVVFGFSFIHKDKYAIIHSLIHKQNEEILLLNQKLEQKNKEIADSAYKMYLKNELVNSAIVNLSLKVNLLNNKNKPYIEEEFFNANIRPYNRCYLDTKISYINYLFPNSKGTFDNSAQLEKEPNFFYTCGTSPNEENAQIIANSLKYGKQVYIIEDCFLRSIFSVAFKNIEPKFQKSIGFTIDDLTSYYDANFTNRLEQMLNNKDLIISEEQKNRAKNCIQKIVNTHLSKYNNQPIFEPKIGREGVKKVLVIDQSYGDMSILRGWGSEEIFEKMLQAAIDENPDADIIVKTHPDTMSGTRGGYYTGIKAHDNIYTQTESINPISLIKYVDKVYVCTTQFGFEALMCGKEVHVFGMPFYAGWGLTNDRQKCERRTNTRTLEEVFYIAYIMYSYYVNPDKQCRCEIEEAMDYLLKLREEYLMFYKID